MKFMLKKQASACALLAGLAAAGAGAATPVAAADPMMTLAQRRAYAMSLAAGRAPSTAPAGKAASGAKIDQAPPVLTGFAVKAPGDVAQAEAQVRIDVTATDNLSGVYFVTAIFVGPHGQTFDVYSSVTSMPATKFSQRLAIDAPAYLEPGTWTIREILLQDAAGNNISYDTAALSALGVPSIEIVNSRPGLVDYTAPTLKSGKVLTPQVSISALAKGTQDMPAFFGASFAAVDTGSSGVYRVDAIWCLADGSTCESTLALENLRGQAKETLTVTNQIGYWMIPGEYILQSVSLQDHAGNSTWLLGTDFGGATDFSALMPLGHTITLTP